MIPSLMPNYARADIAFERGEGAYLYATNGETYLDFAGGIAVVALGHCHPHLVAALSNQAGALWHTSNLYRIPAGERLAQRLVDNTFADSVLFCNSGAEAVECGLKMIRRFHDQSGNPDRYRVITCTDAFHGRTLATIAAGGQPKLLEGFDPVVDGFDHVAFGNLNEMRAAITDKTAAILVEPVQGEGGLQSASDDYMRGLREVCDEFSLLLMLDEIQCGVGRTGRLFAYEWSAVEPDIMAVAKGLGGGFPVGACLAREHVAKFLTPGTHGTTFGGNPLAMAVTNAVLDVMLADGFLEGVRAKADSFRRQLTELAKSYPKVIGELRGMGLMVGLRCEDGVTNADLAACLMEKKMLSVLAGDNVVRLLPPLIIEQHHVDDAMSRLEECCKALSA